MSRNSNQGSNIWVVSLLVGVGIIYNGLDKAFFEPKREAEAVQLAKEEQQELIKLWSEPTIDFFKSFNCSNLKYEEQEFKITKFIAVDSYINNECHVDIDTDISYDKYKIFDSIYTRKINEKTLSFGLFKKEERQKEHTQEVKKQSD